MFWNKKDYVKRFDHEMVIAEIAKMIGGEHRVDGWLKIPGDKRITNTELANKLDLILDHLKLKYVPETKEPAKLVEETETQKKWFGYPVGYMDVPVSRKKKRGRPKKK